MKVITSKYHLLMHFPTEEWVWEVGGDQTTACEWYRASLKGKESEALVIDDLEDREDPLSKQTGLVEDLEELSIDPERIERVFRVGQQLLEQLKLCLQKLLTTHRDVFAWTHTNMPGIDPRVITHRLSIDPSVKPVKQKNQTFVVDRNQAKGWIHTRSHISWLGC